MLVPRLRRRESLTMIPARALTMATKRLPNCRVRFVEHQERDSGLIRGARCQWSANDAVVFLDLRDDLRIGQLIRGLDSNDTLSQLLGATETLLELQLGLTWPEDQNGLGLSQLTDDLVVVRIKVLAVAFLVFFLAPAILRA